MRKPSIVDIRELEILARERYKLWKLGKSVSRDDGDLKHIRKLLCNRIKSNRRESQRLLVRLFG